jgi:cysteinyl-tRNA synthetase
VNQLTLYNTMTGRQEPFTPRRRGKVKLFTCGPSVYRRQHLGNYRTYLFEDVLQRYLVYRGLTVERVINFTDIEDKAIEEARANGVSVAALRRPVEEAFFAECAQLGILLPDSIPRASTSIAAAVNLIERLVRRGHAYWHEGEVFFDPLTYDGFGRLYGLDMDRWPAKKVRFRQDTYPGQRWNRGDFIIWHHCEEADGEVCWETAIGRGRPAWNIQDAAMISENLGFEIDIHTGGIDNLYRHHDYTLAIMEGASGKRFCPWWLHGGHLLVDGRKMSKSKGNVTYVDDLLPRGFQPRHIRFFLLNGPYREDLDLRISRLEAAAGRLDRVRRLVAGLHERRTPKARTPSQDPATALRGDFEKAMNDNLNVAGAFDAVAHWLERAAGQDSVEGIPPRNRRDLQKALKDIDQVLGVIGETSHSSMLI